MSSALRGLVDEMLDALAPLVDAAGDPDALTFLLSELGWTPASIPKPLSDLAAAGSKLVGLLEADPDSVTLPQALDAIAALVTAIDTIRAQPDAAFPTGIDIAAFKSTIGRDLFDYLLVEHLLTSASRHRRRAPARGCAETRRHARRGVAATVPASRSGVE